ncbi:hypothetical protein [Planctomycetes bacterium TBK1r]|uniref:Twin-arginine translocation signal domain-containing protein n=1 Tax=Stieleria magnilauensis TaxID=2527963 RepID=A0ABX5Y384_9BACT|nr:hypothetical protein TBK1r_77750 [Planctomycetes bacterium TBK1r]
MSDPNTNPAVDAIVEQALRGEVPRRDFLRRLVVAGLSSAAAYQVLDETTASAQSGGSGRLTTFALGEEGNPPSLPPQTHPPYQQATTLAVGEESSKPPANQITTKAVGEESSRPPANQITTYAVGEESPKPPTPQITTKAVGEESTKPPTARPTTHAIGEESTQPPTTLSYGLGEDGRRATTMAVGEEGQPTPNPITTNRSGEESQVTTHAVGEESNRTPNATTLAWGEEGSTRKPQFKVPSSPFKNIPRPWKNFRRW